MKEIWFIHKMTDILYTPRMKRYVTRQDYAYAQSLKEIHK